jgi:hypothetical protein
MAAFMVCVVFKTKTLLQSLIAFRMGFNSTQQEALPIAIIPRTNII